MWKLPIRKKWKCVTDAAHRCHHAGNEAAQERLAASGEFAIVGERLGETHGDPRAHRARQL